MSLTIKSGGNPQNVADVSKSGRLLAHTDEVPYGAWASWAAAEAYTVASGQITVPSPIDVAMPAGGYPALWLGNSSKTKALVISQFLSTHDQGKTSDPTANAFFKLRNFGVQYALPPTANTNAAVGARRNNLSDLSPVDVLTYGWNGAGAGMTMPAGSYNGSGFSPCIQMIETFLKMTTEETFVLPPGGAFGVMLAVAPVNLPTGKTMDIQLSIYCYHIDAKAPFGG